MELDPGLVCYRHCEAGTLIAQQLPGACTLCGASLRTAQSLLETPYRLPFPLRRASQSPCTLVIKPTKGDFLHDYESGDDLHIGITDSEGCVHEFSSDGLQSDSGGAFGACLVVSLLGDTEDPVWQEYWNTALSTTIAAHDWSEESYDETERNCYSFVIEFLKTLQPPALRHFNLTKLSFCSSFVVPRASAAARYIALYRAVKKDGCVALRSQDTAQLGLSSTKDGNPHGTRQDPEGRSSDSFNELVKSPEERLQALSSSGHCSNHEWNARERSNYRQKRFVNHRTYVKSRTDVETESGVQPTKAESDPESDIENRVSKVIEDLLESQRVEQSRRYLTHYADDIKQDLRSVVPPKPRCPKSFVVLPHRSITPQPDPSPQSSDNKISNSGGHSCVGRNRPLHPAPSLSSKISKFSYQSGDVKQRPRNAELSAINAQGIHARPENRTLNSAQAPKNTKDFVRSSDSTAESFSHPTPVLENRVSLTETHKVSNVLDTEMISLQVKCAVKNLSIEICDDNDALKRPNSTVLSENNHNTATERRENITSVKIDSEKIGNSSSVNNTVTYNEWVAEGAPAEPTAGEFVSSFVPAVLTTSKWSSAVLSRRSSPENEMNIGDSSLGRSSGQSHVQRNIDSNFITSRTQGIASSGLAGANEPLESRSRGDSPQLNSAQRQSIACRQIVELCSKFEKPTFSSFGKGNPLPKARRPLRREQTWRYGQEPCPQNYEGKLMGKLDVSKGFDWDTKGRPSTLSMPGYIYEDGVLPETRC